MTSEEYADRDVYRRRMSPGGLVGFTVSAGQSDLHLSAARDLSAEAGRALAAVRSEIEDYIKTHPGFREALEPWPADPEAPHIVAGMIAAGTAAGTGPMAAVAGAVAAAVGRALLPQSPEVVVENGGDVFMASRGERIAAVFAGASPLSMKLGLKLPPAPEGIGLCTSSGTVGPSLSRGRADAAVVLAPRTDLADAVATALGNQVSGPEDLAAAMEFAEGVEGLTGALVVLGENLAAWGGMEIVEI